MILFRSTLWSGLYNNTVITLIKLRKAYPRGGSQASHFLRPKALRRLIHSFSFPIVLHGRPHSAALPMGLQLTKSHPEIAGTKPKKGKECLKKRPWEERMGRVRTKQREIKRVWAGRRNEGPTSKEQWFEFPALQVKSFYPGFTLLQLSRGHESHPEWFVWTWPVRKAHHLTSGRFRVQASLLHQVQVRWSSPAAQLQQTKWMLCSRPHSHSEDLKGPLRNN